MQDREHHATGLAAAQRKYNETKRLLTDPPPAYEKLNSAQRAAWTKTHEDTLSRAKSEAHYHAVALRRLRQHGTLQT